MPTGLLPDWVSHSTMWSNAGGILERGLRPSCDQRNEFGNTCSCSLAGQVIAASGGLLLGLARRGRCAGVDAPRLRALEGVLREAHAWGGRAKAALQVCVGAGGRPTALASVLTPDGCEGAGGWPAVAFTHCC